MAYCRWSTDDFQCDVYVYADVNGGYTTHLAKTRYVFQEPLPEEVPFDAKHIPEFMERHKKVMEMCAAAKFEPIELPHAGECFNLDKEGTVALLEKLRGLGYRFPANTIQAIQEDEE